MIKLREEGEKEERVNKGRKRRLTTPGNVQKIIKLNIE